MQIGGWKLTPGLFAGIGLLLLMMGSCEEDNTRMVYQLNEPDTLSSEVYQVYSEMIQARFPDQQYIVIRQETDTAVNRPFCRELMKADSVDLSESTVSQYLFRNQELKNLGYYFDIQPEIKLITGEELNSYESWNSFHDKHPDGEGVMILNMPGFNDDKSGALFEYSWLTGDDRAGHYMVYLKYQSADWNLVAHEKIENNSTDHPPAI